VAYTLGVDLGTTFSAAATIDEDGVPTMVGLGNRALQIPSVVFVRDDGSMIVGEQAEREATTDPTRVVREFKRRVGDDIPIVVAGKPYSPELMMAQVLRWVIEQTTDRRGEAPTRVSLTHPAAWTRDYKVGKLHEAARLAGLDSISTCPEPVAAAMNYASQHRVEVGDRICVYDLGGGTFDVCVLAKTATGFEILGNPSGDALLGGIDFDKAITGKVSRDLSALFATADLDDPGFFRFQRDCVEAKESLSADVATVIGVSIAGTTTSVRLTRAEFEAMIDPLLTETISKTALELSSAGVDAADLRSIVLIGGSSRIPLVTEKLTSAFHCPVARNTHPKHDVALGAALAGWLENPGHTVIVGGDHVPAAARDRPNHRRRLMRASAAGVGAVVIIVGGFVVGGRFWAGANSAGADSTAPIAPTTTATVQSPVIASPSPATASPSLGSRGTGSMGPSATPSRTQSADSSTTPTTPSTPAVPPPSSLDQDTVAWLRQLCAGGNQMKLLQLSPTKRYPSVDAAQAQWVDSYAQRAAVADSTATRLEQITPGPVAGGRVDPGPVITRLRELAVIMRNGANVLQQLDPPTPETIAQSVGNIEAQIDPEETLADVRKLSTPELAFVGSLPGCENISN
jgi:actin-like ATPase involved in cell morphogenesis